MTVKHTHTHVHTLACTHTPHHTCTKTYCTYTCMHTHTFSYFYAQTTCLHMYLHAHVHVHTHRCLGVKWIQKRHVVIFPVVGGRWMVLMCAMQHMMKLWRWYVMLAVLSGLWCKAWSTPLAWAVFFSFFLITPSCSVSSLCCGCVSWLRCWWQGVSVLKRILKDPELFECWSCYGLGTPLK